MDRNDFNDEKSESRLYVGNLDLRITEAALIKMFSPFGKLYLRIFYGILVSQSVESRGVSLLSSTAPKREARLAKEKMHGRLACARPFVVRLASERYLADLAEKSSEGVGETSKAGGGSAGSSLGQMSRSARIAAIKNKLKALEEESSSAKKQKHADS